MGATTTVTLTLTAQTRVAELAELIDKRIRVTKPHGKKVTGDLSYARHLPNNRGIELNWVGDPNPSHVPYGSHVEIMEASR